MAASDALVGVHSANENQQETDVSLAVTTLMARDAAKDGIPPAIIGKMVETTPGRVEWLTGAGVPLAAPGLMLAEPGAAPVPSPAPPEVTAVPSGATATRSAAAASARCASVPDMPVT